MTEETKMMEEGIKVGQFSFTWPQLLLSPHEKKGKKNSPLACISQRYILINPSQITQNTGISYFKIEVDRHMCVYSYIHHMFGEEKRCVKTEDWCCSRSFSSWKEKRKKWLKEMVWGTGVKWQVLPTCLQAHLGSHGGPDCPIFLPLSLVSIRETKRKEHFVGNILLTPDSLNPLVRQASSI